MFASCLSFEFFQETSEHLRTYLLVWCWVGVVSNCSDHGIVLGDRVPKTVLYTAISQGTDSVFSAISNKWVILNALHRVSCVNQTPRGQVKYHCVFRDIQHNSRPTKTKCLYLKLIKHTMEALPTDTLVSGQLYLRPPSQNLVFLTSHTNSVFLHSRKRPAPVTGTFFASRPCPLTRASTLLMFLLFRMKRIWKIRLARFVLWNIL